MSSGAGVPAGTGGSVAPAGGTATVGGRVAIGGASRAGMTQIGAPTDGAPAECSLCCSTWPAAFW
eukprot:4331336-Alexandrium_andersonii.AAC.1